MWVDSHCHLHLCEENGNAADFVERARAESVDQIIAIGIDAASSIRARDLAVEYDLVFSAGIHPNSAVDWNESSQSAVEELLEHERCVAVGESGLDFYRDYAPEPLQREAFAAHIGFAKRFDKTLVIHTRDSLDAALEMVELDGPPDRLVFHCWSAAGPLERVLDTGAFVSFAGNVSFKNAEDLRKDAARVPKDRLLVETDSPFLSPVPFRGKPNEPARVAVVGAAVAEARGESTEKVAEVSSANARRLFGLDR
jgi:TatD DNase family protein